MDSISALSHLSPAQHRALYENAKRQAAVLRREAITDFFSALAAAVRRPWRGALRSGLHPQEAACPPMSWARPAR